MGTRRVQSFDSKEEGRFFSWLVKVGDSVDVGCPIAEVDTERGIEVDTERGIETVCSTNDGIVRELVASPSKIVNPGDRLLVVEVCEHGVQFGGMCAICGKDLTSSRRSDIAIAHAHPMLTVTRDEAEKIDHETAKRLLGERKLSLVLDLDNTLIHATTEMFFQQVPHASQINLIAENIKVFQLPESPIRYFVKLRHGLFEFLESVNSMFELHVYTMGRRHYANHISAIIDPQKTLFRDRILSRDECSDMNFKTLHRLFPCDDSMVVIVDDREDVWKRSRNLVRIEPFVYFTGGPEINALPMDKQKSSKSNNINNQQLPPEHSPDQTAITNENDTNNHNNNNSSSSSSSSSSNNNNNNNSDKKSKPIHWPPPPDDFLDCTLTVLKEIHKRFYQQKLERAIAPDVKAIIGAIKSEILRGCRIVFSALFPMDANPTRTYEWRHVTDLGGACQLEVGTTTTHVVAVKKGTSKVNRAINLPGVYVVHPNWLYACIKRWKRMNEHDYPLESVPVQSIKPLDEPQKPFPLSNGEPEDSSPSEDSHHRLIPPNISEMDREVQEFLEDGGEDDDDNNDDNDDFDDAEASDDEGVFEVREADDGDDGSEYGAGDYDDEGDPRYRRKRSRDEIDDFDENDELARILEDELKNT